MKLAIYKHDTDLEGDLNTPWSPEPFFPRLTHENVLISVGLLKSSFRLESPNSLLSALSLYLNISNEKSQVQGCLGGSMG